MPNQALSPILGWEQKFGTKNAFVGELFGPTLYAAGGQVVNASQIGWGGFDVFTVVGLSYSGTYYCHVQYMPVDAAPSVPTPGGNAQVKVLWFVKATGVEAGAIDLSAEVVRFFAMGY